MNESGGGPADAAAAGPDTPGGMLRAERERRGYSVQYAAEDLHLDVWVIEALEANRFEALGAPVYAKGHLRRYAMLLGLAPATVLERYEALSGTPLEPTPIPAAIAAPVPQRRSMPKAPLWIAAAIAVAAGVAWLVYEFWPMLRHSDVVTTSEVPAVTPPQQTPSEQPAQVERQVEQKIEQKVEQASSPAPAPVTATAANEVRLRLQFSEPSWAEIYDSTGKRLMFDMGTPGRVRTIAGVPPLRVNLGLASAVSAQVDDRPIVIPRRAGRDGAKFQIEADGSVRPDTSLQTAER
ncbi:MAG TPA: helix-turn-helix domain-containing protein [Steroidobacteraceae bacterium]|nr:helix-turn-helix domain-containing protein [Steroidobacteraceae bacterium]